MAIIYIIKILLLIFKIIIANFFVLKNSICLIIKKTFAII